MFYRVDYIFTEFFFDFFKFYISLVILFENIINFVFSLSNDILPRIVRALIGYCHFYYQLGYGLIFYIYFFRRYKAKKYNNWKTFYGNSFLNWAFFNLSIFNKFIFNRNFLIYLKTLLAKSYQIMLFLLNLKNNSTFFSTKLKYIIKYNFNKNIYIAWTPLFKRSSYILFLTALKRFNKRK